MCHFFGELQYWVVHLELSGPRNRVRSYPGPRMSQDERPHPIPGELTKPTTTTQRKQRPLLYFCIITSLKYKLRMVNLQYCFKIMWRCDNSPSMNAWEHSWAKPTNASSVLTMCGLRAYQFRTTSCQVSRAYGKNVDTTFFAPTNISIMQVQFVQFKKNKTNFKWAKTNLQNYL